MAVDIIDFFKADGYSMLSLTTLMQKIPWNPSAFTGLFSFEGIATTTALIEIEDQVVSILPTSPRGSNTPTKSANEKHNRVTFEVPHIETADSMMADSLMGVRTLGGSETEAIDSAIAKLMAQQKANLAATWEYHAAKAITTGVVLDANGDTLLDLNTLFGITRPSVNFLLSTPTTDVRAKCVEAARASRDALKGVAHSGLRGFAGRNFFDALVSHATVTDSYKYQQGQVNRDNDDAEVFRYGGIDWELYDTYVGNTAYVHSDKAYVVPTGVPNGYEWIGAPSDRMTGGVGTIGVPAYNWVKPLDDDKGQKMTSQSNPAFVARYGNAIVTCNKIS